MVATNFAAATGQRISSSAIDAAFAQALTANGGDASETKVKATYPSGITSPYPRTLSDLHGTVIRAKDYGTSVGGGANDDWQALHDAIVAVNSIEGSSAPFPVNLLFEPGFYKYEQALPPITVPCRVISTDPRAAILFPTGGFDALQFLGSGTGALSSFAGVRGLAINCAGQTGVFSAISVDTSADFRVLDALLLANACGITMRQCSNIAVEKTEMDGFATYGIKSYGTGGSRNGGTDLNNVVKLQDLNLCGSADGSRVTNQADVLLFDGAVQTVRVVAVSAINAGRALHTTNTPGAPMPLDGQFFYMFDFEGENMANEVLRLENGTAFEFHTLFAAGAGSNAVKNSEGTVVVTTSSPVPNIYLGAIGRAKFFGGETSSAGSHGMDIQGPKSVELHGFDSYFNSQAEGSVYSGINIGAVDRFSMVGGLSGANKAKLHDPGYAAETQLWGINQANTVSGAHVSAFDADLTGNASTGGPNTGGTILNLSTCRTS